MAGPGRCVSVVWGLEPDYVSERERAAEVLADDDVGGQLAPERGNLDVLLLEDADALLVADAGDPGFPLDLVVRVHARTGPAAREIAAVIGTMGGIMIKPLNG